MRHAAPKGRALLDVLTCIREKRTLATAGRLLAENAERHLKAPMAMAALFADRPDLLRNAEALAERLSFTLEDLGYRFPDYPVPAGETQFSFLCQATEAGARERYRPYHEKARRQIERELALIGKLNLAGYFLIVWDLVNFCRREGILVQGRGSAANSAVCYSLGITAVDPVGMELLFERFLSEERGEWPDIDLDLPSGDRRERVIQHVYARYGAAGAAMTANVITYRDRSASREIGKVLGIPEDEIDRLGAAHAPLRVRGRGRHAGEAPRARGARPRATGGSRSSPGSSRRSRTCRGTSASTRAGMVVAQGRLDEVVPLEPASMPGRVIVQWDKEDCADLGIIKVDLLGLGMMSALQDALALLRGTGVEIDLAHLPPDDPKVYAMLRKADTVGVFQVESRAQMATLPRMKPDHFYDLVVEVAIIRPGPIVGKMVHPYLRRRNGEEPVGVPAPLARADPEAHPRRAALPGAAPADRHDRGRLHRRRGGGAAPGHGLQALGEAHEGDRGAAALGDGRAGDHRGDRRHDRPLDQLVRPLRLPRVARGELRPHRLRERLPQVPPPGGLHLRAPQQPADGLLPPVHAGEGRAAARGALPARWT